MATQWSLTIDCACPAKLAEFWALALGYVQPPPPRWPRVLPAAERLVAAGATVIRTDIMQGRGDHIVMADPEGDEFDVP